MKRFAAHYLYFNEQIIIPKGVVELNENGVVSSIFSLLQSPETQHTLFFNGILFYSHLSIEVLRLKLILLQDDVTLDIWRVLGIVADKIEIGTVPKLFLIEGIELVNKQLSSSFRLVSLT